MNLALTVLLTGLTVVFSVLILLTIVIKVYGLIISKIQNKVVKPNSNNLINNDDDDIDQEVLAVIFAAVAHMYSDDSKYKIKSIKRVFTSRPAWGNASIIENTKPF